MQPYFNGQSGLPTPYATCRQAPYVFITGAFVLPHPDKAAKVRGSLPPGTSTICTTHAWPCFCHDTQLAKACPCFAIPREERTGSMYLTACGP
jgi:hypothetical protein